jgi:hypothetical protein
MLQTDIFFIYQEPRPGTIYRLPVFTLVQDTLRGDVPPPAAPIRR